MQFHWKKFLKRFEQSVLKDSSEEKLDAVQWLRIVNPYKGNSYFEKFLDFMRSSRAEDQSATELQPSVSPTAHRDRRRRLPGGSPTAGLTTTTKGVPA